MTTEYRLTLAGATPAEVVALRALPDGWECHTPVRTPVWSNESADALGFEVGVHAGANGYFDAEADDGHWQWEPAAYVAVTFAVNQDADPERAVLAMLTVIRRVLDTGPEDAAFVLNGDRLLLRRTSGRLVKHTRAAWWAHYAGADKLIAER
jgi:hypothetical protein